MGHSQSAWFEKVNGSFHEALWMGMGPAVGVTLCGPKEMAWQSW